MFTGIVECMGTVLAYHPPGHQRGNTETSNSPSAQQWSREGCATVVIGGDTIDLVLSDVRVGDSIAVDGVCLTVTSFILKGTSTGPSGDAGVPNESSFTVDLAPETLRRTHLGNTLALPLARVNLERSLSVGARYGGHMVQGHVDTTVTIADRRADGDALVLTFRVSEPSSVVGSAEENPSSATPSSSDLLTYIVPKGYVSLDGTSLTVIDVNRVARTFSVMLIPHTQAHVTLPHKQIGDKVNLEVDQMGKYVESVVLGMFGVSNLHKVRQMFQSL